MRAVIGLDYGTQAARAILADAGNGEILCSHTVKYPHGVVEGGLACAEDYEEALSLARSKAEKFLGRTGGSISE